MCPKIRIEITFSITLDKKERFDTGQTQSLIRKLTPIIDKLPIWWNISSGLDVYVRRLGNLIFALAKIAIVYS